MRVGKVLNSRSDLQGLSRAHTISY